MQASSPNTSDAVFTACQAGAEEAAEALSRALDCPLTLQVESPAPVAPDRLPNELDGPGLVVLLHVEKQAALVLLPESSGLVPAWYAAPDATGQSKLSTLGQELGMLLLPDHCAAERFEWLRAVNLAGVVRAAGIAESTAMISMPATAADGRRGVIQLVWPVTKPEAVVRAAAVPATSPVPAGAAGKTKAGGKPAAAPPRTSPRPTDLRELPLYTRSLMRVKVPVVVTLARKRQPVSRIVELGPGCIIQFDKSCEEMLDLYLGGRMIANGEAVKVGDKFGLRITNIVLPEERFHPLRAPNK